MAFKPLLILVIILLQGTCSQSGHIINESIPSVTIEVGVSSTTKQLGAEFWGFNTQMMRGPSWKTPGFIEQVKRLHPQLIRYPGGTVASYWDWRTGWLKEGIPLKGDWAKIPKNPITIQDLKWACDQTGAAPIFVLNMMNSELQDQISFLKAADSIGLMIKYVELDNEIYLGQKFYANKFPTGEDYAKEASIWAEAILKLFPEAKLSLSGHADRGPNAGNIKAYPSRGNSWNRELVSYAKNYDAVTFHIYSGSGLKYLSDKNNNTTEAENFYNTLQNPKSIEFILGIPFTSVESFQAIDLNYVEVDKKAWITEYNLFEKEGILAGTWCHGLYALTQTILIGSCKETEILCYHNLTTSAQFAAIFNSSNGFEKAYKKQETELFGLTAAGECLSLFGEAIIGANQLSKLTFSQNEELKTFKGGKYPSLIGIQLKGNKTRLLIVNLSDSEQKLNCASFFSEQPAYKSIQADPDTQISKNSDVKRLEGKGTSITLSPYSVTLISGN